MDQLFKTLPIAPLLLKNGGVDRNMCSLNSNLQILRHIPEFIAELRQLQNTSELIISLSSVLSHCGSYQSTSALLLRENLARATGRDFNSGAQNDTVELLSYLLDHSSSKLFYFNTSSEYRFWINSSAVVCPTCDHFPDTVPGSDKILRLTLPRSFTNLSLNYLLERHFQIQIQSEGRRCEFCSLQNVHSPKLPYKEKLNFQKNPQYLLIQLIRMNFIGGKTMKNSSAVHLPNTINVDKYHYSVIGTISHMGSAQVGHNRAYLKHGSKWYLCEDSKFPIERKPIDSLSEQNYCILLKRCYDAYF